MNHTTNYSLPQWEDADRVTRGDVNGAMSSIDAALAANAPQLVKLYDAATSEDLLMQIDIPYAALSPEKYALLLLIIERPFGAALAATNNRLYVDAEKTGYRITGNSTEQYQLGYEYDGGIQLLRTDPIDNYLRCTSVMHSNGTISLRKYYFAGKTADQITNLNFIATGHGSLYPAGTRIRIYGLKG